MSKSIEEILGKIYAEVEYNQHHGGCPPSVKAVKVNGKPEAEQALYDLILSEVVGAWEIYLEIKDENNIHNEAIIQRNTLRNEQMTKLAQLFGREG